MSSPSGKLERESIQVYILLHLSLVWIRRIGRQEEFKIPLCNFSGGNLRQSCQTSTKELLCINSQEPKHNDCFGKKNPPPQTSDQILNVDPTRSDLRRCKSGVWVQCKRLEFVAVGWCRRKWLRLYQTIGNLTSGDMGILLVLIRQGVTDWNRSGSCIS